jgi:DNA-binding SARP family transcriptional activator
MALLAVLAAAGEQGRSRDQLLLLFWPEAAQSQARHSLEQLLYTTRTSMNKAVFSGVNPLRLNSEVVSSDVGEFYRALERGDLEAAVSEYRGPFLEGFFLSDSPEFEQWLDAERAQLERSYCGALEELARRAEASQQPATAVRWWRKLADTDPVSGKNATGLMRALMNAGDEVAALQYAERYETIVQRELGTSAGPAVANIVAEARAKTKRVPKPTGNAPSPPEPRQPANAAVADATPAEHRVADARVQRRWRAAPALAASVLIVVALGAYAVWRARSPASGPPTPVVTQSSLAGWTSAAPTKDAAAYDLYLRARHDLEMRSDTGFRAAVADYRAAIGLDSTFADAYAGLSEAYSLLRETGAFDSYPLRETARAAESAALKAISLADSRAPGHLALGLVRMTGRMNFAESERELLRARALDPADPDARGFLVVLYGWTGRPDEALRDAREAVSADPLSMDALRELARALYFARRYEEELVDIDRMRTIAPVRAANLIAAETYDIEGRYEAALRELAHNPNEYAEAVRGYTLARMGNRAAADSVLRDVVDGWGRGKKGAFEVAILYLGERDLDRAFQWIDKSFDDMSFAGEIMDPLYDDLRADPRFAAVARRIGLTSSARKSASTVAGLVDHDL